MKSSKYNNFILVTILFLIFIIGVYPAKYILTLYLLGIFIERRLAVKYMLAMLLILPFFVYARSFELAEKLAFSSYVLFVGVVVSYIFDQVKDSHPILEPVRKHNVRVVMTTLLFVFALLAKISLQISQALYSI